MLKLKSLPQRAKILSLFALLAILFASFVFYREYRRVTQQRITSWEEDINVDCAVVLTGGAWRVREGFDLLARHQAKKLILSGVYPNATLHEIFPMLPYYGSVDERDIILDRRSETTFGNARQTQPIVEALKCRDVAVVTSRLHMYRALRTFAASYPETITLVPRAVISGRSESSFFEISTEVLKSVFYSLWAY